MTREQKQSAREMRWQGLSYTQIARTLELSVNTVKSFCRRKNICLDAALADTARGARSGFCKRCGKRLEQTGKGRAKTFCNDECRYAWWNAHHERMNRKAFYDLTCAYCGKAFKSYGNKNRKYCRHECYIRDRFGVYGRETRA